MTSKTVTFGLLWHSMNSDNLGVGALTVSHMAILEEACAAVGVTPRFRVIGWTDPKPFYFERPNLEVVQLRMSDFPKPNGLWKVFRGCDIVMDIGGGDSFADIYGGGRIMKMMAAQNLAMFAGKPLSLSPQTIGPFANPRLKRLALNVMRRAASVVTRDSMSTAFAREMGFKGNLIEASDVAFRLPYDPPEPRADDGKVRVGLNVSGLLMNGGYTGDNMFGLTVDYPALVKSVIEDFIARPECELHLVGHVISDSQPIEDDHRASLEIAKSYEGVQVAPAFKTPSEAKNYISGMDYFMGARMHACIAALSSGVPVMPTAYSRKFKGVFGTVGYDHCADCKSEDAETILGKIRDGYQNRAQLKLEAEAAAKDGVERLNVYQRWVEGFLKERFVHNAKAA